MKKKMLIGIGVACLTAGIWLAGCGASSNTGETAETTTITETTTAETTTTTAETTTTTTETPTEAWKEKFSGAAVMPKENPNNVWENKHYIEVRLNNGIHIYLPTFFDNLENIEFGNLGYSIVEMDVDTHRGVGDVYYGEYDTKAKQITDSKTYHECSTNGVMMGVHEGVGNIEGLVVSGTKSDDDIHRYYLIGEKDGQKYYLDFTPNYGLAEGYGLDGAWSSAEDYYNEYWDLICKTAWVDSDTEKTTIETTTQENTTSSVAQTIIEGNVIKSVVLNVEPPKVGENVEITTNEGSGAIHQSYWPKVTYDDSCHIHMNPTKYYGSGSSGSACRWFADYTDKIDFTYLFEGTIESGKSYVAGLIIYPEDGYSFSDDLKIFVNGALADKVLYIKSTPGEYEPAEADFEVKLQAE